MRSVEAASGTEWGTRSLDWTRASLVSPKVHNITIQTTLMHA